MSKENKTKFVKNIVRESYNLESFDKELELYLKDNAVSKKLTDVCKHVFEEIIAQNMVPFSDIYYNIYPINIEADYSSQTGCMTIKFKYTGANYDPIEGYRDLSAAIVKKLAKDVNYSYNDGVNYLSVVLQ